MNIRTLALALPLMLMAATQAFAHDARIGDIEIDHPWARATVTGQPSGGGYVKLTNKGQDDKLLAIRSDVSGSVELHTMQMDKDIMRMRQVDGVALPAGKTVEFSPGGYHIMFMKLKAPFKEGGSFPATLVFEKAGEVKVDFKIEPMNYGSGSASHHMH